MENNNEPNSQDTPFSKGFWLSVASSVLVGSILMLFGYVKPNDNDTLSILIYGIPIICSGIIGYVCRKETFRSTLLASVITSAILLLLSLIIMQEGFICVLIISPFLVGMLVGLSFLWRFLFRLMNQKLNIGFGVLQLILGFSGLIFPDRELRTVRDELTIQAKPEEIFKYVVDFPEINEPSDYWLFQLGLPKPVQTTSFSRSVGAKRFCIFSNGVVFDERITKLEPNEYLEFQVTKMPHDPEILGHFELETGSFRLCPNSDGSTTLIGISTYRIYVFPAWYYDWWAESIIRAVHLRVMKHIQKLAMNTNVAQS
ncbi:MAG: hypothetical protein NZ108_03700 [Bacteroidia bacterium]|nr:hypothetical protein [Bacteroidia bacterium]